MYMTKSKIIVCTKTALFIVHIFYISAQSERKLTISLVKQGQYYDFCFDRLNDIKSRALSLMSF